MQQCFQERTAHSQTLIPAEPFSAWERRYRIVTFEVFQDEASAQTTAGAPAMFPFYRRLQEVVVSVETTPLDRLAGFLR